MCIRMVLVLGLLAAVPACGRVDSSGSMTSGGGNAEGPGSVPESGSLIKPAFYQTSAAADPEAADAASSAGASLSQGAATDGRIEQCLAAIEQLQARMDQLHNQNLQMMAALGIDDQQPAPPPPAGSLADQVLDLREAVKLLAANGEALRRAIEEQTVTLKPALPGSADGKLTVENNTDSDRQMWINGTPYWIWANSKLSVHVPVGEVTTKVSSEQAKTWELTSPGEEVRIEIVRTSQVASTLEP
jgi:hypothetical protein